MLSIAVLPIALAAAPNIDPDAYYRLTTEFQGECKSLDVVNDATDDKIVLAPSAEVSGQYWKITPVGNGHYRLTTMFQGANKSLDVVNDATDDKLHLAPTGNFSGQHWRIAPAGDGRYRLTTVFQGPGKSLDVVNDETDDTLALAKTANVSGQRWRLSKESDVGPPPPHLKLDPFYKKYLDADGIPIVSSNKVPDAALYRVRHTMRQMLSRVPAAKKRIIHNKVKIALMSTSEKTRQIPEYRNFGPFTSDGRHVDTVRGFSASPLIPVQLGAEENVMCHGSDPARGEDIFVHEFAHTMHRMGLEPAFGSPFATELAAAFANAKSKKLWANTYADTTIDEYFAEGVQAWFNLNLEGPAGGNGIHNHVNTRAELKKHDPKLHGLLSKYFPADQNNCSCTPAAAGPSGGGSSSAPSTKKRRFRLVRPRR